MPEVECTHLPGGKKLVKFLPTPLMSTYILAFCVGEFDYVQVWLANVLLPTLSVS